MRRRHLQAAKRSVRREAYLSPESSIVLARGALMTTPSRQLRRKEQVELVRAAVQTMRENDREVLLLRHVEELSNAEVAETLLPAVKGRLADTQLAADVLDRRTGLGLPQGHDDLFVRESAFAHGPSRRPPERAWQRAQGYAISRVAMDQESGNRSVIGVPPSRAQERHEDLRGPEG